LDFQSLQVSLLYDEGIVFQNGRYFMKLVSIACGKDDFNFFRSFRLSQVSSHSPW
jgi:hypothetical protein